MSYQNGTPFTAEEDRIILDRWRTTSLAALARQMQRHPDSLQRRAERLGLEVPDGGMATDRAAERSVREATHQLARRIREVAHLRGVPLPILTARGGA